MVASLKRYQTYLFTILVFGIGLGVPFIAYAIDKSFPYPYLILIIGCIYAILAYVFGDIIIVKYKRKNPNVVDKFPVEVEKSIWTARWPFIFSFILLVIIFVIFFIIFKTTGHWPLL